MALDTEQELASIINLSSVVNLTYPSPTTEFSQADLQHLAGGYSGILWVTIYPDIAKVVRHRYITGDGISVISENMADASEWMKAESGEPESLQLAELDVKVVNDEDLVHYRVDFDAISGTVLLPSDDEVQKGTTIIFQVVPPTGYQLKRWLRNDVAVSTDNPAAIKINSNNTVIYAELETV